MTDNAKALEALEVLKHKASGLGYSGILPLVENLESALTAPAEPVGQSGWLVEKHENDQITYLTLDGTGIPEWVADAGRGLRCCRRSDAEQLAAGSELYDVRIVEHMWPDNPAPPSDAARIAELEAALGGFDDDYMTSEAHHPNYVLIPTAVFERVRAAALHAKLKGDV